MKQLAKFIIPLVAIFTCTAQAKTNLCEWTYTNIPQSIPYEQTLQHLASTAPAWIPVKNDEPPNLAHNDRILRCIIPESIAQFADPVFFAPPPIVATRESIAIFAGKRASFFFSLEAVAKARIPPSMVPVENYLIVPIDKSEIGEPLILRLKHPTNLVPYARETEFANHLEIIKRGLTADAPSFLMGWGSMLTGIFVTILWLFRREATLAAFAAMLILYGAFILLRTISLTEFGLGTVIGWRLVPIYLFLPATCFFLLAAFEREKKHFLVRLSTILTMALALTAIGAKSLELATLRQFLSSWEILALGCIPILLYHPARLAWKGDREARIFLLGLIAVIVAGGTDVITDITEANHIRIGHYGVLGFFVSIGAILGRRIWLMHKQVQTTAADLATKNEELKRLDGLKDDFLANTSHELRTPLNGIIGLADSLVAGVRGPLDAEVVQDLSLIVHSGKRLMNLVNDILDFSKMKHNDVVLKTSAIDLRTMGDLVLTLLRTLVINRPITLHNAIPATCPPALADESRVEQILNNIVGNAIKFTEKGDIYLTVEPLANGVKVIVDDTGIGINAETAKTVFNPFEQGDSSASRRYGGTGLGLAVSKSLVELHGGKIGIEPRQGGGTRVWFTLPRAEGPTQNRSGSDLQSVAKMAPTPETQIFPTKNEKLQMSVGAGLYRILVIDDEPVNLRVIGNYLTLAQWCADLFTSPQEGLQHLETITPLPDLVLLDLMMPDLNGFEVCKRIRSRYGPNELPVILLTAKNQVGDLLHGFECGANDYVTKPVSRHELTARIQSHLTIRSLSESMAESREDKARIEKDMEAARAVQETLIPQIPTVPGAEIAVHYASADQTGGDWYGVFHMPECDTVFAFVGDITGHGISSALLAGLAAGTVFGFFEHLEHNADCQPVKVLTDLASILNGVMCASGARANRGMTMAFVSLNLRNGQVHYLNAGHPHLIRRLNERYRGVPARGPVLGIHPARPEFHTQEFTLDRDEILLLYSDGLIENENESGEVVTQNRLKKVVIGSPQSAAAVVNSIVDYAQTLWKDTRIKDDVTILSLQWTAGREN